MIILKNDAAVMQIDPARGGGILRFDIANAPIFMPARAGTSPLDLSNFAMLPFANRISGGCFSFQDKHIAMEPNFPEADRQNAIHGYAWQAAWQIVEQETDRLVLGFHHEAGSWPWDYSAQQEFRLRSDGYSHIIRITNHSASDMPITFGLHPYFPAGATIETPFEGYWETDSNNLPSTWTPVDQGCDILSLDFVDNLFTGPNNPIVLAWPDRRLTIRPAHDLPHTHIFRPKHGDFFCVEPCSHMADAFNREGGFIIAPGQNRETKVDFLVELTGQSSF